MELRIGALNRFTRGWMAYFRIAETSSVFQALDRWLYRRLRQIRWKEWKRYRARRHNLCSLGIAAPDARHWAASSEGCWRIAGSPVLTRALPRAYWDTLGLQGLSQSWLRLRTTS